MASVDLNCSAPTKPEDTLSTQVSPRKSRTAAATISSPVRQDQFVTPVKYPHAVSPNRKKQKLSADKKAQSISPNALFCSPPRSPRDCYESRVGSPLRDKGSFMVWRSLDPSKVNSDCNPNEMYALAKQVLEKYAAAQQVSTPTPVALPAEDTLEQEAASTLKSLASDRSPFKQSKEPM